MNKLKDFLRLKIRKNKLHSLLKLMGKKQFCVLQLGIKINLFTQKEILLLNMKISHH